MKRLKQIFTISFLLLLLVGYVFAEEIVSSDTSQGRDYNFQGSFNKEYEDSPNANLFSFTSEPVNSLSCKQTGVRSSPYLVKQGTNTASGTVCAVGNYIRYYKNVNGVNTDLFEHLWYKSSSSDLINFNSYWTNTLPDFNAVSECYSCNFVTAPTTTYTCYNSQWRGEPSTAYGGIDGTCQYGCKK